jgi:sec-independent protein translocase protein TatC
VITQPSKPTMSQGQQPQEEEAAMTLIEHLVELRGRLIKASIGVILGLAVGVFLVLGPVRLVDVIISTFAPLRTDVNYAPIQSVGTTESFTSYMTVALTVGLILGMPVIVYQLLAFIVPGLTDKERRLIYISLPFVTLFFLSGVVFGWFITVPTAIKFLIGFSDSALIQTQPSLADFLGTITTLLLINGVVFELPIIIYVLAFIGVVTAKQLGSFRRFAVVIVVIVAAVITPTGDPINLALLAIPMYLLYEVGVIMARFVPKRA